MVQISIERVLQKTDYLGKVTQSLLRQDFPDTRHSRRQALELSVNASKQPDSLEVEDLPSIQKHLHTRPFSLSLTVSIMPIPTGMLSEGPYY